MIPNKSIPYLAKSMITGKELTRESKEQKAYTLFRFERSATILDKTDKKKKSDEWPNADKTKKYKYCLHHPINNLK